MAKKTVAEADKYCADRGKELKQQKDMKGGSKVKHTPDGCAYITLEGADYFLQTPPPPAAAPPPALAAHFAQLLTDPLPTADDALKAWAAIEDPHVSIDWGASVNLVDAASLTLFLLFADSGANIHISNCKDDFLELREISPCPICGFQGSSINTLGIRTIVTDKFVLHNVLYVLDASSASCPSPASAKPPRTRSISMLQLLGSPCLPMASSAMAH
jgi:hypothetical protein